MIDLYDEKTMEIVHSSSLGILKEIIALCDKHGLSCVSLFGTTLGAVRHNGFIPWDDDVDLGMPRADYEKFLTIAPRELPSFLTLHNFPINRDFTTYFSKVCDKRTTFIDRENQSLKDYPHHIWVDIFPIDKICSDPKEQISHFRKVNRLYELFKCKTLWRVSDISTRKKRIIGGILRPVLHILLLPIPKRTLFNSFQKALQRFNSTETPYVATYIAVGKPKVFLFSDLFPGIRHRFENVEIPIPNNFDLILRKTYGEYMVLPPIEKRYGHKPLVVENHEQD